jgi:hypothetical protein
MTACRLGTSPSFLSRWVVLLTIVAALMPAAIVWSAATSTTQHGLDAGSLDGMISSTDLIQGRQTLNFDVFVNSIDSFGNQSLPGWHPANTNPADQHAAFTDGAGILASGLTGLLNDNFPVETASGRPAKIVEYPFDSPVSIGQINLFTGNRNNADGRIFSTTYIEYSTDNGSSYQPLGYFQSDPSGTINNEVAPVPPLDPAQKSTLVSVFDDGSATLLSGVTNLIFNFYSVDNTGGQMRDPFDGENMFTGFDDGLSAAFVSPLVFEIDVLAPQQGLVGDYNSNNVVDAADYVVWRDSVGGATLPNRDPAVVGLVGQADYGAWRARFGNALGAGVGSSAAVPEPSTWGLIASLLSALFGIRATKRELTYCFVVHDRSSQCRLVRR